ncbi:hypothetical protein EH31_02025 [Erythrobacter longus]|uniref:Tetratricopeptide repeat protein n=1 Tax=Erythrobacter longus TaxID=1044 RepID=A0A074N0M3_ERYLO|nr:hypothetical protein [Erythrobacter longus]KEO91467.1 hypothetical protein EH31_02025 [Erythrobacter longus]
MITLLSRKRTSSLALAIALATGGAVVATAVYPTEAAAQRKKKKDENDGGGYSAEFREVYVPLDELLKSENPDLTGLKNKLENLAGFLNSSDEKLAGGQMIYNSGTQLQDQALQLRGMEFMIASGKLPPENLGRYNFIAYQIANQLGQLPKSRTYLQAAMDNNFTAEGVTASGLRVAMMESFFSGGEYSAGFDYLTQAIEAQKAQGQPVDETWYRRGLTVAYENELSPQVYEVAAMWLNDYPSSTNWRDTINIARNLNDFQPAEMLDLFRLSRSAGALIDPADYDYYVEVADARRLPSEVKTVIEEGKASGVVKENNLYLAEALDIANSRIAADRADLPALERDAKASGAGLRTIVAAGDAFLSYGQYAKAAGFYERALTMPGVETNEELTRLAIAQAGMGDYTAARTTLARVSGTRAPIAMLWMAFIDQEAAKSGAAPAVMPSAAPATASE